MEKVTDVVEQKLRLQLEPIFVAGLLIPLVLSAYCQGKSDPPPAWEGMEEVSQQSLNSVQDTPPQDSDAQPDEDFAPHTEAGTDADQPPTDLGTGLPLHTLSTPFRWGNLSLLSFTTYEGYNSNPGYLRIPVSSYLTSMSGSVLYSSNFAGWQMSAQYLPFVWFSSRATIKSFSAASVDLRTLRRLNDNWRGTFVDRFRYAPSHSNEQTPGVVAEPGGGFTIGNAFLSSGRNVLANGAAATLTDRYSENSSFVFHANQSITRLSSYIGSQIADNLPAQDAITFTSGLTWRHHYSSSSTVSLDYNYLVQTSTGSVVAGVQTHSAGVGWSHKFGPTLGISASFGPAWSLYNRHQTMSRPSADRTTVHGSLALSKQFRHGGAVLSGARSDGFSGIISNSFQNRYDFTAFRQISTRLHCSASASYVQQQILNARNTDGELFSGETRYFLSHSWSLFGQVRYLKIAGSQRAMAPETNVIVGFRWVWSPQRP